MEQPDREEMRELAAKLATSIPASTKEHHYAVLIAEGRIPYVEVVRHFRRVALYVRDSKSQRISKPVRAEATEWLARWGGSLRGGELRGAQRLEMRLTLDEYDQIKRAADKAGLSLADYARRATLVNAERTLGGK